MNFRRVTVTGTCIPCACHDSDLNPVDMRSRRISAELVTRDLTATATNQAWVADLAYVRPESGWVCVAFTPRVPCQAEA